MHGSRNFRQGGGGPGQSDKKSSDNVFFFSPKLILQKSNGQFQRNLSFFKVPEGVLHFPGGGGGFNFFQGGSDCLFPIETHITCVFPGRSGPPAPPLDPHLVKSHVTVQIFLYKGPRRQSVTCLATDACLTADPGVPSLIAVRSHTSIDIDRGIISTVTFLPSAESFKKKL